MVIEQTMDWAWEMHMKECAAKGDERAKEALEKFRRGEFKK